MTGSAARYVLYGCAGCGSAVIEALLERAGADFDFHAVEPWTPGAATDALKQVNPLAQVPTLALPDATVMTESAAMIVLLDEAFPDAGILPRRGTAQRALALRWLVFIAANMYAAVSVGDFPERWVEGESACAALKAGALERMKAYWKLLEGAMAPAPYLAGAELCALDIYAATLSHWRPGRAWVDANCPRVAAALALTEADSIAVRVWSRNFKH